MSTIFPRGILGALMTITLVWSGAGGQEPLQIKGYYLCISGQSGTVELEYLAYVISGSADRLRAVDQDDEEVANCIVRGSGTAALPFTVSTAVDISAGQQATGNNCGAVLTTDQLGTISATWTFRGYPNSGLEFDSVLLNATCRVDDLTSGVVRTEIGINVPIFSVRPLNPSDSTGDKAVVVGAPLVYTAIFYPNGNQFNPEALRDKAGIYLYNCESATDENFVQNRQLIVNATGCPVSNSPYAPTSAFERVSTPGVVPIVIQALGPPASIVNNTNSIYVRCLAGYCTVGTDPNCLRRCGASPTNTAVDANVPVTDQLLVQELEPLTLDIVRSDDLAPRKLFFVGDTVKIVVTGFPGAQGANSALINAAGIHVGECVRSFSSTFEPSAQITSGDGCRVTTGDTVIQDDFQSEQEGNFFKVISGDVTLQEMPQYQVFLSCAVYGCNSRDDTRCSVRCGSGTSNAEFIGRVSTSYSVIRTDESPVALRITGGAASLTSGQAILGSVRRFTATLIPQTASNELQSAQGWYLYDCSYAMTELDTNRVTFIDSNGCVVDQFTTSECRLISPDGEPPFVLDCGEFSVFNEGNSMHFQCGIGICYDTRNPLCSGTRCGKGPAGPATNSKDTGITVSGGLTLVPRGRTAEESEPLRIIIGVVSGVGAFLCVLLIMVIACLILRKQKQKLLEEDDTNTFAY